jgi:hypothetical protein
MEVKLLLGWELPECRFWRRECVTVERLLALVAIALMSTGFAACGGASKHAGPTFRGSSRILAGGGSVVAPNRASSNLRYLKGDEDDDDSPAGYTGSSKYDDDADFDNDYKKESNGFYDSDDIGVLDYGHAADVAELKAVSGVLDRYHAAAAVDDGARACSMMDSSLAKSLPEDYGQSPGPAYLRGAGTCKAVLTLVFKHHHNLVDGSIELTAVRVAGHRAFALLGSKTKPASDVLLEREHDSWKVASLLSSRLP